MEFIPSWHLKGNHLKQIAMRTLLVLGLALVSLPSLAQNTFGDIIGTFYDKEFKSGIPFAPVFTQSGDAVYRAITDEDGRFRISAVPAGVYQVYFINVEDTIAAPNTVEVSPDGYGDLGMVYSVQENTLTGYTVVHDRDELKLTRGVAPEIKLAGKEYRLSPQKFDTKAMVTTMTPEVKMNNDGELIFRGARAGDVICYLDGVKMNDVPRVPSAAVGFMMVYSGAIPAKYGDTNGGVVVIETLSYTDLWKDWKRRTELSDR